MAIDARPFLDRLVEEKSGDIVVCFKASSRDVYEYYILVEKGEERDAGTLKYRYEGSPYLDFTPWELEFENFQVDKVACAVPRKRSATTIYLSNWSDD